MSVPTRSILTTESNDFRSLLLDSLSPQPSIINYTISPSHETTERIRIHVRNSKTSQQKALSSSERGRKFRATKQLYLSQLVNDVGILKGKIQDLTKIYHYHETVHKKIQDSSVEACKLKAITCSMQLYALGNKNILQHYPFQDIIHPDVQYMCIHKGNMKVGLQTLLMDWHEFCASHTKIHVIPGPINIVESKPDIIIMVHLQLRLELGTKTLKAFFPPVLADQMYVEELNGLEIQVSVQHKMIFNNEGKCMKIFTRLELLSGLVQALGNIQDAIDLLQLSTFKNSTDQEFTPSLL